jgi:alkanesulfonate monooxygenase SsuD/methylene tetrahydromethanopterin reductase-like flavin-dependent oxidoreductase (luciferase family)
MRPSDLAEKIPALKQKAEAAGRDPDSISISIFAAKPDRAFIEKLEQAGVHRAVFALPPADRETVLPLLDRYAGLSPS